jgi:glycosyltransferase involved in cell wall biosynthesis
MNVSEDEPVHNPRDAYGRKMKVVQINSGDLMGRRFNGFDLKEHLDPLGVDSRMLVYWNKNSDAAFVSQAFSYPGSRYVTRAFDVIERQASLHARLHPHSWALTLHKAVRDADLMHLHIIHDGYFSLSALPYVTRKKPTVWTWHDPWPMTGHCIHPLQCRRWQSGCGACPDLSLPFPMKRDRTAEQFSWKQQVYSKTKAEVVVASQWMLEMAQQSPLAEHFNLSLIPFGLDLNVYKPGDRDAARARLKVLPGLPVILIRALATAFKGLPQFIQALRSLSPDRRICIIVVQEKGHFEEFRGHHQILEFGWTDSESLLLDMYAACDFLAMPSKAEAFGMMAIEAMACGRPVLSLEGTALPGVTFAPTAGLAVPADDVSALANGIKHLISNPEECARRGRLSRMLALQHYDITRQAQLTAELYRRVLGRVDGVS